MNKVSFYDWIHTSKRLKHKRTKEKEDNLAEIRDAMRRKNPNIYFKSDTVARSSLVLEATDVSFFEAYENEPNVTFDDLVRIFQQDIEYGNTLEVALQKLLN